MIENIVAELRRIGLDPDELGALAGREGGADGLLAHLRSLSPGASWAAAFPSTPERSHPSAPLEERAFGPFDFAEPPRGPAVFAGLMPDDHHHHAVEALAHVNTLGIPIFGSGVVLDRGAPHLYVIFPLDTSTDDVEAAAALLRTLPGIATSYPAR